jgi:hypothetical protein
VSTPLAGASRGHALRTARPTRLVIEHDDRLSGFALVHLTQVLAVDANAILTAAVDRAREGARALDAALDGAPARRDELRSASRGTDRFRVLALRATPPVERVPLALALAHTDARATRRGGMTLVEVRESALAQVRSVLLALGSVVGVSAVHGDPADLSGAVEEAVAELTAAPDPAPRGASGPAALHGARPHPGSGPATVSSDGTRASDDLGPDADDHASALWREFRGRRVSLLTRSHSEAEAIIAAVLGPLAGDDSRMTVLRETVFAFLDHDLAWNVTATVLGIHRQSLVYRLNHAERLTGRSLRRTKDIAELWLARTAWAAQRA